MFSDLLEPAAKRVLALLPVLLGVSLLVFALTAVGLGDPARAMLGQRADPEVVQQIRRDYALDRPVHVRYLTWMSWLVRVDLGTSYHQQRPVAEIIAERLPATVRLALAATAIAVVVGLAAGIVAALRPGRLLDQLLMSAAVLGISESAISHQMRELRLLKLVTAEKRGRMVYYRLADSHIRHVFEDALKHVKE